jgi:predicted nucleic acid-binding protein
MYLVDTNVISEARKGPRSNGGVRRFLQNVDDGTAYLAVQTLGELRRGVERIRHRGDIEQAGLLEAWLETVVTQYADRILDFDGDCAQVWGKLLVTSPHHPIDKQIAAIALIHDLTVATRNTDDFSGTGVALYNPFD